MLLLLPPPRLPLTPQLTLSRRRPHTGLLSSGVCVVALSVGRRPHRQLIAAPAVCRRCLVRLEQREGTITIPMGRPLAMIAPSSRCRSHSSSRHSNSSSGHGRRGRGAAVMATRWCECGHQAVLVDFGQCGCCHVEWRHTHVTIHAYGGSRAGRRHISGTRGRRWASCEWRGLVFVGLVLLLVCDGDERPAVIAALVVSHNA
mmetsp:Transcript_19790/g.47974  ORF Transcript_19790/g.47974 Transcript_19790/m.47974 type:complete len:202 (+) Transcript_19790:218-823(+)